MKRCTKKTALWGGGLAAFCLLAYLLIFEIPLGFTPLRYKPQEMTVWRYGESVTLQQGDKDFNALYHLLRDAGKGTVSHILRYGAICDSYHPLHDYVDDPDLYHQNTITVFAKYDDVQKGRLPASYGIEYDQVVFIVKPEDEKTTIDLPMWGENFVALHVNTQETELSYLKWHSFRGYGPLDRVAEYVHSMNFAD